jgi:hypothetical protein
MGRSGIARIGALRADVATSPARGRTFHRSQGADMSRNSLDHRNILVAVAVAALFTGSAFADDSSMSRLTGDSYAFFNDLDYSAGKFNVARAPRSEGRDGFAKAATKSQRDTAAPMVSSTRTEPAKSSAPIRDDRGT